MKRYIGIMVMLCLALPLVGTATSRIDLHGRSRASATRRSTRIHNVALLSDRNAGRIGVRWTDSSGPKDFIVRNSTPYPIYARIAFTDSCLQAEAFENFGPESAYAVRKQACIPVAVMGDIWIGGKMQDGKIVGGNRVPLVAWRPGGNRLPDASRRHDAAFGAGWVVCMNPDGQTATIYFAGGFSLDRGGWEGTDQRWLSGSGCPRKK